MTEISTPEGDDLIAAAKDYGILFTAEADGWYWQTEEDAKRGDNGFNNGPFASQLLAAEDFASGSDDFTLSCA